MISGFDSLLASVSVHRDAGAPRLSILLQRPLPTSLAANNTILLTSASPDVRLTAAARRPRGRLGVVVRTNELTQFKADQRASAIVSFAGTRGAA